MNGITVLIKGTLQTSLNPAAVRRDRERLSVNREECPHWRLDLLMLDLRHPSFQDCEKQTSVVYKLPAYSTLF